MTMYGYNVTLNGVHVEKVYFDENLDEKDVKTDLVTQDGFSPEIVVTKVQAKPHRTDDTDEVW